jgi:hypothetical protein
MSTCINPVILSGVAASLCEAATESKDPALACGGINAERHSDDVAGGLAGIP